MCYFCHLLMKSEIEKKELKCSFFEAWTETQSTYLANIQKKINPVVKKKTHGHKK